MAVLALVALWAFAEATLFFIVADVPIMAIGIRHGPRRAIVAACIAALAAAAGGLAMLEWAARDPVASRAAIESLPGIGSALVDRAVAGWNEGGAWAMLTASFGGTPYKLYAYAAGIGGTGAAGFLLASIAARLPRFLLVALVAGLAGPHLRRRLPPGLLWPLFAGCWIAFYAAYFVAMAGG